MVFKEDIRLRVRLLLKPSDVKLHYFNIIHVTNSTEFLIIVKALTYENSKPAIDKEVAFTFALYLPLKEVCQDV